MKKLYIIIVATLVACLFGAPSAIAAKKGVTGTVTCDGKGIAGVVVTDGVNMTKTNDKGFYSLPTKVKDPHCQFVHISIPSGYEVERVGNAPQFYKRVNPELRRQTFDFKLIKVDQSSYSIYAIADIHVANGRFRWNHKEDAEKYRASLVKTLDECVKATKEPVYVISLGDMTHPGTRPGYKGRTGGYSFENYMEDTKVDAPIFNSMGNHDHNRPAVKGTYFTEETVYQSRADFNRDLGPEYYSFTIGRDHYVVVDNLFIITSDAHSTRDPKATKGCWIRLCERQHSWLERDIAALDRSKVDRIIYVAHAGLLNSKGKFLQLDGERVANYFKGYEVVTLIGHHHADRSQKIKFNDKPIYQFVHPSGAGTGWYTFDNCEGTPAAIAHYQFNNGKIKRTYVPYGDNEGAAHYRVYDNGENKWHYPITSRTGTKNKYETEVAAATAEDKPAILVNVWGAYTCEFTESTGGRGKARKRLYDLKYRDWYWPMLERSLAGEVPEVARLKKAAWQTPKIGDHIWQYVPMDPDAEIRVVAKDLFGNVVADFKARAK